MVRGVQKAGVECVPLRLSKLPVAVAFVVLAKQRGRLLQHSQVLIVEGRGSDAGSCEVGEAGVAGTDVVPIAQSVGDDSVASPRREISDVAAHHVILCGNETALTGAFKHI